MTVISVSGDSGRAVDGVEMSEARLREKPGREPKPLDHEHLSLVLLGKPERSYEQ